MSAIDKVIADSDKAHADDDVATNFAILDNAITNEGLKSPQLEWRMGRACYQVAQEKTTKEEKQPLIERALSHVSAAVKDADDEYAAHKWMGIILGEQGKFVATKEKIANAYVIRDHFKRAIELNPADATSHHCLGVWHWNILQIGMVERAAASVLFGSPPSTTYEDCEASLLKSAELDPGQIYNNLLLGDFYYYMRKWDDAKAWFTKASECPAKTEHQKRLKEEAAGKIGKC